MMEITMREPKVFPMHWPLKAGGRPMLWVIDRFEGEWAVCENSRREMRNVARSQLPHGAKAGDVLRNTRAGYLIDSAETAKRQKNIEELTKDLWG
jgi:hypothetical protein